MHLRRFTPAGLDAFRTELAQLREDPRREPPTRLLDDKQATEVISPAVEVTRTTFTTRMAAADYLNSLIGSPPPDGLLQDKGLWSWLSLFFFDSVAPKAAKSKRKIGADNRHIPDLLDYRRYYRHLLLGPYLIYRAHADNPQRANLVLCQPPCTPGDFVEQIASRQEIVANKTIIEVCTRLFYDPNTGKPKADLGGKARGSIRRLADVLNQYDRTWDLVAINANDLLARLPKEFTRLAATP